ncbi:MAG: HlyD family efflux transporter periplasmic adaptor subunit [Candidatus Aminicenantes bacterium]|nr:HlyD family efflux transporter periplasmic adaptor subunit [Candidatus Aminicenantes bacterium]
MNKSPSKEPTMGMDRKIEKKKWPPKRIASLAAVGLFVILVLYVFLFRLNKSTLNVKTERITISTVTRGPFQEFIPIMGNVLPINTFYLNAVEGGRVEEIYLEAGTIVKEGDGILRLANTNLLLDIMWREAELFQQSNNLRNTRLSMEQYRLRLNQDLAEINNQLRQQKRTYERYKELVKNSLISKHEYELAKDQYEYLIKKKELTIESQRNDLEFRLGQIDALESSLKRMQDNLEIVKQKQDNLTIRAPVSGHLTALNAEIGQSKSPGQPLGQIDVLEGFRVRAAIDEHYIARIETGRTGEFDFAGKSYGLVIKKIYPEVIDGRFEVDMEFVDGGPEGITRGQTLHIRLELGDISEAILLPRGGFYQTTGGNWAYVVDESENVATKRKISLGRQNPQVFEVLEGLEPGDRVITSSYESFGNMDRLVLK